MVSNIPACGIKPYMDGQVEELLPPNRWWRIMQSVNRAGLIWAAVGVALFIFTVIRDYHRSATFFSSPGDSVTILSVVADALLLLGFGGYGLWLVAMYFARDPGVWRRYSLQTFADRYSGVSLPPVETVVSGIRAKDALAEFELAVLEKKFPDPQKPEHFGLILFQVAPWARKQQSDPAGGEPLCICGKDGRQHQFGEAYVPFGSFAKA